MPDQQNLFAEPVLGFGIWHLAAYCTDIIEANQLLKTATIRI
jgi:hypothetical protein